VAQIVLPSLIPVTFDGEILQRDDLGIFLYLTSGLFEPPSVRGVDVMVPHLDGRVDRPRRVDRLTITLAGHVLGNGADGDAIREDFIERVRFLRTLFWPTRDAADLVAGPLPDGSTWTIAARPADNADPVIYTASKGLEYTAVSVALFSNVPTWSVVEGP
jgi:hypothetical protein